MMLRASNSGHEAMALNTRYLCRIRKAVMITLSNRMDSHKSLHSARKSRRVFLVFHPILLQRHQVERETTLPFLPSAASNDWNSSANASKGMTSPVCRGRGITSAPSFGRVGPWHKCDSKRCSHPVGMMQRALSNTFVSLGAVAWCGLTKVLDWEAIKLDGNARARLIFCTDTAAAATRSRDVVPFHA